MKKDPSPSALLIDRLVGNQHALTRDITSIGRSPSSDLRLDDRSISRQHAAIYYLHQTFYLEDLDSLNGTCLNGVPIKERVQIKAGDEIRFGLSSMLFMLIPNRSASACADNDDPASTLPPGNPVLQIPSSVRRELAAVTKYNW